MKKVKDKIEQDGVEFEAFKCGSCGEEIMNMKQLKLLAQKYRKLRQAKEITFSKWGNSIAVRIPTEIVNEYRIKSGKQGILTKDKEGIRIIPV
ncbi:MAG: AbrB/MazE/SpoVT family DNA-binding domain-containing protein [Nanoarchaeota archaeon]